MARKQAEFVGDPRYCSSSFYIERAAAVARISYKLSLLAGHDQRSR